MSELKQKYKRGTFVEIKRGVCCGYTGIVGYTYSEMYKGNDIKSYSLYVIKEDKIYDRISWYEESDLILCSEQDYDKAAIMIEQYNMNKL